MKNIKVLFILIVLILLCGCSVEDNITINEDGTIKESVTITQDNNIIGSQNKKEFVNEKLDSQKLVLDYKNYRSKVVLNKDSSGAEIYKEYDSVCDMFGNSAFNQYIYKYMQCTEDDKYIEVKNKTEYIPYCSNCEEIPDLQNVVVNIKLPYALASNNADDVSGNTYTWYYGKGTENGKEFYIKIRKTDVKKAKLNYENKQAESKRIQKMKIIVGIIVVVIALLFLGYVFLIQKHRKNKLDY